MQLMFLAIESFIRPRRLAFLGLLSLLHFAANALSCSGVQDRFFVKCIAQQCKVEFRAREISSLGACGRRVVVEAVPADIQSVLLSQTGELKLPGLYEVILVHRFYGEPPINASELAKAFKVPEFRSRRMTVKALSLDTNLDELHEQWGSRARKDFWAHIGRWGIELITLGALLFVTFRTASTFSKRLRGLAQGRLSDTANTPVMFPQYPHQQATVHPVIHAQQPSRCTQKTSGKLSRR